MNVPPSPTQGWWRRNAGWLAGALVLGTAAFLLPYRAALSDLDNSTPRHRIEGAATGWSPYEGAGWRITGVEIDTGAGRAVADYPHAPGNVLLVHYEVLPGNGVSARQLDSCKGRLVAADGRQWPANEPWKLLRRVQGRGINTACGTRPGGGMARLQAQPGQPFAFTHVYLLPAGTPLQGLRVDILLPPVNTTPPGSYLSFSLPAPKAVQ